MREVSGKYTEREAHDCPSRKPTEVGGVEDCGKVIETPVNTGLSRITGYPRCGEGCGDTLKEFNSRGLQPPK